MKSPFTYMGAKSAVADTLAPILAPMPGETFIDLMVGGGSVTFGKTPAHYTIINDFDPDVAGIFIVLKTNPKRLAAELKRLAPARMTYDQIQRERFSRAWWELTDVQRAARMIYIFSCAVNGKPNSSFPASTMTPLRFRPDRDLQPWAAALRSVVIENLHYGELLRRYVRDQSKVRCLIYADPPYVLAQAGRHYRHTFTAVDHVLLAYELTDISQRNGGDRRVRIAVSYDDDPDGFIRDLYRPEFGWRVGTLAVPYAGGNRANVTNELLITNFDPQPVPIISDPRSAGNWTDIPSDGLVVGGVPFTERDCCTKERFALMLHAKLRGRCRACGSDVTVCI
jgi:site-specific DNA-adenine methylase